MQGQPPEGTGRWQRFRPGRGRSLVWRISVPVAFACAGLLATTSAINARGTDLRGDRSTSLIQIVSDQRSKVEAMRAQTAKLQQQVEQLAEQVKGGQVDRLRRRVDQMEVPAAVRGLAGPGLVVTLDDAPRGEPVPPGLDPNLLVVHQQDIQAVVNALWAGGAEGVSLQGQRIISTTGIKCVGNTVVLQGVPYAPPYRIVAVGHATTMYDGLLASPEVRNYREFVAPPYNLGWSLRTSSRLSVPAYSGSLTLDYAKPVVP
jgi:uncharacterized protein YlxW (UPF0749 family)